ncbi:MAG: hypothetical protein PHG40_03380 [Candidatus Omnitrophica bacterium]|nr:hypothetical protein [Candidatus Omnitrophota bacterium]
MQKIKYDFDPHNRLVAASDALLGVRKVIDGQFKIDAKNNLVYHLKSPLPEGPKAPHQIKLKGEWSLTKDHQLCLALDKWRRQTFGDQVTIQGQILEARENSLLFAVTTRTKDGKSSLYTLELAGSWQADERNRLTFKVDKGGDDFDALTFEGAWQIDKNYQIIYEYRSKKGIHTLAFKGFWDIKDRTRLSYAIEGDTDSIFDFKTSAGIFRDGYIKYELGIGLARKKRPVRRVITFFGKWKLKKGAGLVFEVEQEEGRPQAIVFGAEAKLTGKGSVSFNLRNSLNKKIGAELELSRDIFKEDGQAFLRLLKSEQERAIVAGAGWRW